MTADQEQKLYNLLIDSFNRSTQKGMAVFEWVDHMKELGCVLRPSPKNMMMASMGIRTVYGPKGYEFNKSNNFFRVKTNCFGNVYVPKQLAFKVLVMEFFP